MILTGKAKEDFLKWVMWQSEYTDNSNHLIRYEDSERGEFLWYGKETDLLKESKFLNALIIEWLDSVGIVIQIDCGNLRYSDIKETWYQGGVLGYKFGNTFKLRQESITEAIEKANEIYNNLNTKQDEK